MNILGKLAVWYLAKYNPVTLQKISINKASVSVEMQGYVKDDKDWHHRSVTIEYWVRSVGEGEDDLFGKTTIYEDEKLVRKYSFDCS